MKIVSHHLLAFKVLPKPYFGLRAIIPKLSCEFFQFRIIWNDFSSHIMENSVLKPILHPNPCIKTPWIARVVVARSSSTETSGIDEDHRGIVRVREIICS